MNPIRHKDTTKTVLQEGRFPSYNESTSTEKEC